MESLYICSKYFWEKFLKDFIYLFLERGEGREKGRETWIGCLSYVPRPGTELQPRRAPCPETEPATFRFAG